MNFKNNFEKTIFEATQAIFGTSATIEHNKVLRIESALYTELASFTGPPKKEIDVISANFGENPTASLLISCKDFKGSKVEPADVQEWAAVLNAMSKYSSSTKYFGLIICPNGFTNGCESWATSSNLALIPPLKGKSLKYSESTIVKMFKRAISGFKRRVAFPFEELCNPPHFYNFVYNLTSDFEGFEENARESGSRYILLPNNWHSSFGELAKVCIGKKIKKILCSENSIGLQFNDDYLFLLEGKRILFGNMPSFSILKPVEPDCYKNISMQKCDLDFVNKLILNKTISSAGDFGTYFEFGIESVMNIGFHPNNKIHIVSIVNPITENDL
jgi:hypothetical protein